MESNVYLKIAGVSIRVKTRFPMKLFPTVAPNHQNYLHFISKKPFKNPDIDLELKVARKFPVYKKTILFQTKRDRMDFMPDSIALGGRSRIIVVWRICRTDGGYVLSGGATGRPEYSVTLRSDFKSGTAFVLPKGSGSDKSWYLTQVTHGFLQVLLIHYLACHKKGIFMHASGVRDKQDGYLFFGHSQSGKSTMARIWNRNSQAVILNDDRIIVTKKRGRFFIHGTPWHGDFREYTPMQAGSAKLSGAFFLGGHAAQNKAKAIFRAEFFSALFPQTLSVFWNKSSAEFISGFLSDMTSDVRGYHLQFADNKEIIDYVRSALRV